MNERALLHADQVRTQLSQLLLKLPVDLDIDVNSSCLPEREAVLRCLAYGLFLQTAIKRTPGHVSSSAWDKNKFDCKSGNINRGSALMTSGRLVIGNQESDSTMAYVTMRGGQIVHIHPSSVLFGMSTNTSKRNRLPDHLVYAEQVITSKSYIRYVSRIEGEWLSELQPEYCKAAARENNTA